MKKLVGLKYAKETWEKIESIVGDGTCYNKEFEKNRNEKKNKKKGLQNKEARPQESHIHSASDLANNVLKLENQC